MAHWYACGASVLRELSADYVLSAPEVGVVCFLLSALLTRFAVKYYLPSQLTAIVCKPAVSSVWAMRPAEFAKARPVHARSVGKTLRKDPAHALISLPCGLWQSGLALALVTRRGRRHRALAKRREFTRVCPGLPAPSAVLLPPSAVLLALSARFLPPSAGLLPPSAGLLPPS